MSQCPNCRKHQPFGRRFLIDYRHSPMLPCTYCGAELVHTDRLFLHAAAAIFVYALFLGVPIGDVAWYSELGLKLGVPALYFLLFIPMRKPEPEPQETEEE